MSSPLRLELAGGLYHITSRGDSREDIYVDWFGWFGDDGVRLDPVYSTKTCRFMDCI